MRMTERWNGTAPLRIIGRFHPPRARLLHWVLVAADLAEVESAPVISTPAVPRIGEPLRLSNEGAVHGFSDRAPCYDVARAARTVIKPPARPKFGTWFNRSRRVLLTLAAVWVVAIFDLGYTLAESGTPDFIEANPLAAKLLSGPTHVIVAYKFSLLGLGTVILLALRRHAVAELGCWFLFVLKLYVALRWYSYFDCVLHGYMNPLLRMLG
jgi:hypothetical protein